MTIDILLVLHQVKDIGVNNKNIKYIVDYPTIDSIPVTITTYYPTVYQCDATPNLTADGSYIDDNPFSNKWCAVSRDMFNKGYSYGDTIYIIGTWVYDGYYIIHDTMNKRFKNTVDILISEGMPLLRKSGYIIKTK